MISSIWHGFYPGYFFAFFNWSIYSILAKYCYQASLKFKNFNYENPLYKILRFFISTTIMNYCGAMIFLLNFDLCWRYLV